MGFAVLVVEDDRTIREALGAALVSDGYDVIAVGDRGAALAALAARSFDLAIIDFRLEGDRDGVDVALRARAQGDMGILFVTAADDIDARLDAFAAGADDYVIKPFSLAELRARVKAVLARSRPVVATTWSVGGLAIDEENRAASGPQGLLALTPTEFLLLAALARAPGRAFAKSELLELGWGDTWATENLVEVHVSRLRRKLMECEGVRVETIRGVGYMLKVGTPAANVVGPRGCSSVR